LHAVYKMWCKYFITHIILAAVEVPWHLESFFSHHTSHTHTHTHTIVVIKLLYKFVFVW